MDDTKPTESAEPTEPKPESESRPYSLADLFLDRQALQTMRNRAAATAQKPPDGVLQATWAQTFGALAVYADLCDGLLCRIGEQMHFEALRAQAEAQAAAPALADPPAASIHRSRRNPATVN